jgi:histidinol-phosphate aminotransferase
VAVAAAVDLLAPVDELRRQRELMSQWARGIGLQQSESEANFLYLGHFVDRARVWQRCLDAGVLVRQSGPDGWLRVSIGTPEENEHFMKVMSGLMASSEVLQS